MEIINNNASRRPFTWNHLGEVKIGRENLGEELPVVVYRLMQYTLQDVLSSEYGQEKAHSHFRAAGHLAGVEFSRNVLNLNQDFDSFISHLQEKLKVLKIGILRVEFSDTDTGEIVLTMGEDLDCSGLPVTNETVCVYDEGFLAGIMEMYTGKKYTVNEIDCWASGARTCRFQGRPST